MNTRNKVAATAVPTETCQYCTPEELAAADAVVLVTDHDAFDYESVVDHAPFVLDTRNRMTGPNVERL